MWDYLLVFDIIGTIAFTISGYIISSKSNYDLLGILIISLVTAFGGGIIRDTLVGSIPFVFTASYPLIVAFSVIVLSFILKYHNKEDLENNKLFILADTIGLSVFAYSGAIIAINNNLNFGGILFLSILTATGGGVIRDVIMQKETVVLTSGFYGSVALVIGTLVYIDNFLKTNIYHTITIIILGILLRLIAIKYNWKLLKIKRN